MAMDITQGDFVEIEYECIEKESKKKIEGSNGKIIVPVGKKFLPKFLDKLILDKKKEEGEYLIEKAYGDRRDDLVKIVNINEFLRRNIKPRKGLIVNIDGLIGKILTISGGRVIVDFNHPFAGKDVVVRYKIYRKVEKIEEKIEGLLKFFFGKKIEFKLDKDKKELRINADSKYSDFLKRFLTENIKELEEYHIIIQ